MIGSGAALLILAMLAASNDSRGAAPKAAAVAASDQSGNAYRDHAREAVHDVLAEREFADLHSDPYAIWRLIFTWIGGLFKKLAGALKGLPEWLYWTIVAWMVLILLAILGHLIYTLVTLLRGTRLSPRGAGGRDSISGELLGIADLDFDRVYAEARRLLAAGDWRAATRYFYVAAILWLDRQGWIVFKRSKTNGDYLAELARRGPAQGAFRRLTDLFEPIVYGCRPPTNTSMDAISTTVEGLLHEPAIASPR